MGATPHKTEASGKKTLVLVMLLTWPWHLMWPCVSEHLPFASHGHIRVMFLPSFLFLIFKVRWFHLVRSSIASFSYFTSNFNLAHSGLWRPVSNIDHVEIIGVYNVMGFTDTVLIAFLCLPLSSICSTLRPRSSTWGSRVLQVWQWL